MATVSYPSISTESAHECKVSPHQVLPMEDAAATTPVILHNHDETGLQSSIITQSRMNEKSEQTEQRLEKMRGAVRTLLECIGEDPDREGLQATPSRYAKALLFLTEGYQSDITTVLNGALFSHEGHGSEMVIVKDIEIYSLCEHHLVPFMGKVKYLDIYLRLLYTWSKHNNNHIPPPPPSLLSHSPPFPPEKNKKKLPPPFLISLLFSQTTDPHRLPPAQDAHRPLQTPSHRRNFRPSPTNSRAFDPSNRARDYGSYPSSGRDGGYGVFAFVYGNAGCGEVGDEDGYELWVGVF